MVSAGRTIATRRPIAKAWRTCTTKDRDNGTLTPPFRHSVPPKD